MSLVFISFGVVVRFNDIFFIFLPVEGGYVLHLPTRIYDVKLMEPGFGFTLGEFVSGEDIVEKTDEMRNRHHGENELDEV